VRIARRRTKLNVLARILPHGLVLLAFFVGYLYIFTAPTGKPKPPPVEPQASISIAKAKEKARGGKISEESTLAKGSIFRFTLPKGGEA